MQKSDFQEQKQDFQKRNWTSDFQKKIRLPTTEDFQREKVGLPFSKRKRQILKMINLNWKKERTFSRRRRTSDFENEKSDLGKKDISNKKSDFQNKKVGFSKGKDGLSQGKVGLSKTKVGLYKGKVEL